MIPPLPPYIFFDLDDTILSFDSTRWGAWESVCHDFCAAHAEIPADCLIQAILEIREWFWRDPERHKEGRFNLNEARRTIVREAFKRLHINDVASADQLADTYSALQWEKIHLFPGAFETLQTLQLKGIRMALLTNGMSSVQRTKIERFKLAQFFDHIFIEEEVGCGKPDKKIFETALNAMAIPSADREKHVWMVGDNLSWDIFGAQQMGLFTVWNDYKQAGLPLNPPAIPDLIIHHISALTA